MAIPPSVCISVVATAALAEILVAELGEIGFDIFDLADADSPSKGDAGTTLKAFATFASWQSNKKLAESVLDRYGVRDSLQVEIIEPKNWNESWESSIKPLHVPPFLIRPSWSAPVSGLDHELEILVDPKMSFGTGYHESTRLVLRALPRLVESGVSVMDAGSGTGILAIAAIKLGAERAIAFDFDPWCEINATENFLLNGVQDRVTWYTGTIDDVPTGSYDLILANINKNVLLEVLPELSRRLADRGTVVLAGILQSDRSEMLSAAERCQLALDAESEEGEWWSVELRRAN